MNSICFPPMQVERVRQCSINRNPTADCERRRYIPRPALLGLWRAASYQEPQRIPMARTQRPITTPPDCNGEVQMENLKFSVEEAMVVNLNTQLDSQVTQHVRNRVD